MDISLRSQIQANASRCTGLVSSVAIIAVGDYDGLPNLDGAIKDYENIIKTFCSCCGYNVLFQLCNNKYIYTNDVDVIKLDSNQDYKLNWNMIEIDEFATLKRKYLVRKRHNWLIFVITCHGDRVTIMYDSDLLFGMYQRNATQMIKNYSETEEESNYLSQIPKVFVLDMCRGKMKAKPLKSKVNYNHGTRNPQATQDLEIKSNLNDLDTGNINININNGLNEKVTLKAIGKDVAAQLATDSSNFLKIFATPEGYAVADGAARGGLFLRNFWKVLKDRDLDFILRHYLNDIILKIREYTNVKQQ